MTVDETGVDKTGVDELGINLQKYAQLTEGTLEKTGG